MPFTLAGMAEAEGVGDGARQGWVGVFGALEVELELAPFDDAGVGAVAPWWQAKSGDLIEEIGQEEVEKKGVVSWAARARWQRGMVRRRRRRVLVKLRQSGSRSARAAASAIRQRMARCARTRP
jgi:hypothetical protein